MSNIIETNSFVMRDILPEDITHIRAYAQDPEVMRYLMVWLDTEEEIQAFVEEGAASASTEKRKLFLLSVMEKESGSFIGTALIDVEGHSDSSSEIGYILVRDAWGKGYATEIARALTVFAFEALGMHRVWGKCDELNAASAKILVKCGMKYEGTLREHVWLRDHWRSSQIYGVLKSDVVDKHEL